VRTSWETAEATTAAGVVGEIDVVGTVGAGVLGATTTEAGGAPTVVAGGWTVGAGAGTTVGAGTTGVAAVGKTLAFSTAAKRLSDGVAAGVSFCADWFAGTTISVNPLIAAAPIPTRPSAGVAERSIRGSRASILKAACAWNFCVRLDKGVCYCWSPAQPTVKPS
jgi:hypothetical protein